MSLFSALFGKSHTPEYRLIWNAIVAQHTFEQLDHAEREVIYVDANFLMLRNHLQPFDEPQNTLSPDEDALDDLASELGLTIPPQIRQVGSIALWHFMALAISNKGIRPNSPKSSTISWLQFPSVEEVLAHADSPSDAVIEQVLNDLFSDYGIVMKDRSSD